MIVDTHVHYGGASPQFTPHSADELVAIAKAAGVDRVLQVTTRFKGDNRVSLSDAARHPEGVIGVIASLELTRDDAVAQVAGLREMPGILGFRMIAGTQGTPARFEDFDLEGILGAAERLGLALQAYAPYQESAIAAAARRHPQLRIMVDHTNVRYYPGRDNRDVFRNWPELVSLAKEPNVWIKVSYFPEASQDLDAYPFPTARQCLRELYEQVGPAKLMWGSNFPPVASVCSYRDALDFVRVHCSFLGATDRDAILGANFVANFVP